MELNILIKEIDMCEFDLNKDGIAVDIVNKKYLLTRFNQTIEVSKDDLLKLNNLKFRSLMGKDPFGISNNLTKQDIYNGRDRDLSKHTVMDMWDDVYGIGNFDHIVYMLCDTSKYGHYKFGPLTFNWEPFYVGEGKLNRDKHSSSVGRQLDKGGLKVIRLDYMREHKIKVARYIIGVFQTKVKSEIVEKKIMTLFTSLKQTSLLTNAVFHYTDIPLNKKDYNCIDQVPTLMLAD